MKTLAYVTALAAAIAAAPAFAEGGYLGASYSLVDRTLCSTATDVDVAAASGAVALGEHVQVDGQYVNIDGGDCDQVNLGAHLFNRGERLLWGGYAGYNTFSDAGATVEEWTAALEGQLYFARTTLSGAVGYTNFDSGSGGRDMWSVDAEARHFVTDNFSIQANAGYADPDAALIGDGWAVGIGAEYQFADMPISIHGGWQRTDFAEEIDAVGVGVRYSGNASLFERNRAGASLNRPIGFIERLAGAFSPR
jgi:hypothetical protein